MKIRYVVLACEHNHTIALSRRGSMPFLPAIGQHINFWIERAWQKIGMQPLCIKDMMWDETTNEAIVFLDDQAASVRTLKRCGFKEVSLDALMPMAA